MSDERATTNVYVVGYQNGQLYFKVGQSTNPDSRLRGIQNGCPHRLSLWSYWPASPDLERHVHSRLEDEPGVDSMSGEWFATKSLNREHIVTIIDDAVRRKQHPSPTPVMDAEAISRTLGEALSTAHRCHRMMGEMTREHQRWAEFWEEWAERKLYRAKIEVADMVREVVTNSLGDTVFPIYVSRQEAQKILGVSRRTLENMERDGLIKTAYVGKRRQARFLTAEILNTRLDTSRRDTSHD